MDSLNWYLTNVVKERFEEFWSSLCYLLDPAHVGCQHYSEGIKLCSEKWQVCLYRSRVELFSCRIEVVITLVLIQWVGHPITNKLDYSQKQNTREKNNFNKFKKKKVSLNKFPSKSIEMTNSHQLDYKWNLTPKQSNIVDGFNKDS